MEATPGWRVRSRGGGAALNAQPGQDLAVGGAALAADCIGLGLVDEYRLFVSPIVLGASTPFFLAP